MAGYQIRLGRLFNPVSGRSFVTAIDHAVTIGVPEGNEDALATLQTVIDGGPDAVLLGPGLLNLAADKFAVQGAPSALMRCDFIVNHDYLMPLGKFYRQIATAEYAARLGADAVVMFLMTGADNAEMLKDNMDAITTIADAAHNVGLPLIVESVLWGTRVANLKDPERLAFGARMAFELGADIVKTEYTGDAASMRDIINGCPVPVMVLGGSKTNDMAGLLQGTRDAISVGARGAIYGRNVWQQPDPVAVSRQLRDIIHGT